jgi:hypothetical protein
MVQRKGFLVVVDMANMAAAVVGYVLSHNCTVPSSLTVSQLR